MKNVNALWNQVVIIDSEAIPGTSIYKLIKLFEKDINIRFVLLSDVEGAGTPQLFSDRKTGILDLQDFMNRVVNVKQFDWGNFFLFDSYPNSQYIKDSDLLEIIADTLTTIRAVDDTYIYVYTPSQKIVKLIIDNYNIEGVQCAPLDKLDFPS